MLFGYASVILVLLLGQSRVFYSMSKDGLIPRVFSTIHPKFKTPYKSNLFFLVFISLFAAFVPGRVVGEMTSIGTLFAFILVCLGVLILRRTMPDAPRAFRVPLVPLIPILGIRSEEHTSELQSRGHLVCRLLLEKKKKKQPTLE